MSEATPQFGTIAVAEMYKPVYVNKTPAAKLALNKAYDDFILSLKPGQVGTAKVATRTGPDGKVLNNSRTIMGLIRGAIDRNKDTVERVKIVHNPVKGQVEVQVKAVSITSTVQPSSPPAMAGAR